ncbi:MAG: hypothetical protein IKN84_06110 [Bacteroidales bacterium]|nr:hypothetical protein [Bacteroidales bacterium]
MKKKLLELLEAKFPGARKDGLQQLANSLSLTVTTEDEATAVVGKITADQVADYIKEWRRVADAENSAAAQTRENNIREKYDLTEKGQQQQQQQQQQQTQQMQNGSAQDIQKMIEEAVTKATQGLQSTVATMQATDIAKARREKIEALFGKDTPETYKKTVLAGLEGRTFKDDADFDAFAELTKTNHAAFMQDMADRSLRGEKPLLGGTNKDGVSNAVESYVKTETEQTGNDLGGKDPFKN